MVKGLQMSPGRPTMFYGPAGSYKTTAAHSLLSSVMNGGPVWGHHPARQGSALYLDYEMGPDDAMSMLAGHGPLVDHAYYAYAPGIYLVEENKQFLLDACNGRALCLVDSLLPGLGVVDPNHPSARQAIDMISQVSLLTGCVFLLIHHANKANEAMGSAGFVQACGSIFKFGKAKDRVVTVTHEKAAGPLGILPEFQLAVSIHMENPEDDYASRVTVSMHGKPLETVRLQDANRELHVANCIVHALIQTESVEGRRVTVNVGTVKALTKDSSGPVGNDCFKDALGVAEAAGWISQSPGPRNSILWTLTDAGRTSLSSHPARHPDAVQTGSTRMTPSA